MKSFFFLSLLCLFTATSAYSEDSVPILSRRLPVQKIYKPEPALTAGIGGNMGIRYHDNLYRSPSGRQGDLTAILKPGFSLKGDLKPYELRLDGEIERGQYASETNNNYTDGSLHWQLSHQRHNADLYYLDGSFRYDHVDIGAFTDDPQNQAAEPTPYRYAEAGAGWRHDDSYWLGWLDARSFLYNFDNTQRIGGLSYINDDRDYAQLELTARGGYKILPQTALYLESSLNRRNYDKRIDITLNESHDSNGYEFFSGLVWNTKHDPFSGDAAIGYINQNYSHSLEDVSVPALRAMLQWLPSDQWILRADAAREIREAVLFATSSYVQSRLRLRAEHLLNPLWRIGGTLRITENDFQIASGRNLPPRTDTILDTGIFLHYALSEETNIGIQYFHVNRDSDDPTAIYDANIILMQLGADY